MKKHKAVIVAADIITPFGPGVDPCWQALMAGQSAVAPVGRFATGAFASELAAVIADLHYHGELSLVMQMLVRLFAGEKVAIPVDARLLLATTKGEIDFLEKCVLSGAGDPRESSLHRLLQKVTNLVGISAEATVISAACTSSAAAAARGASLISLGECDAVLVVACDSVTEFVYSGFSSLMALDKQPARPFDRERSGLSVGEAAAFLLLMSEERASSEGRTILGEIAGWGLSDDANHMTGPSRESEGLIRAIHKSLDLAGVTCGEVGFISAHGTGTSYNDAMEMQAFQTVFNRQPLPVYSVKGAIGHTMGAAGLVEIIIALRGLQENIVPPTVNLVEPDDAARGWVMSQPQSFRKGSCALVTNAGFSGVNTAVVLKRNL